MDPLPENQTILNVILAGITSFFIWTVKRFINKFDAVQKAQEQFATIDALKVIELQVAQMASRDELARYMESIREENLAREERMREDRGRMHQENQERFRELREDLTGIRTDFREDIQNVHQRIDGK